MTAELWLESRAGSLQSTIEVEVLGKKDTGGGPLARPAMICFEQAIGRAIACLPLLSLPRRSHQATASSVAFLSSPLALPAGCHVVMLTSFSAKGLALRADDLEARAEAVGLTHDRVRDRETTTDVPIVAHARR